MNRLLQPSATNEPAPASIPATRFSLSLLLRCDICSTIQPPEIASIIAFSGPNRLSGFWFGDPALDAS